MRYASEMGITLNITETMHNVQLSKANDVVNTTSIPAIKQEKTNGRNKAYHNQIINSTWQGVTSLQGKKMNTYNQGVDWLKSWNNASIIHHYIYF